MSKNFLPSDADNDGGNWQRITTAPRDGTPIELKNDYGVMPTYSLCKWVHGEGWKYVNESARGVSDGDHLRTISIPPMALKKRESIGCADCEDKWATTNTITEPPSTALHASNGLE